MAVKSLTRDDPQYTDKIEALLCVLFVPVATLDMSAGSPEGCAMALQMARMAVDSASETVMEIMERQTGNERSPIMKMWLASRHAERN